MSTETNKAAIRRVYEEAFNKGNVAMLKEVQAPSFVYHGTGGIELKGPEGFGQYIAMLRSAFPDAQMTLENIVAEGDYVTHRFTLTGTHKGDLQGTTVIPPTGKRVAAKGSGWSRFEGGKEVEAWQDFDMLTLLQQLGVAPPMG
jgi:predicted ester cyclase